jgi:hypothetical protein
MNTNTCDRCHCEITTDEKGQLVSMLIGKDRTPACDECRGKCEAARELRKLRRVGL